MDYQDYKTTAISHLKTADHLLTMTYPLVADTKLLKLILNNIIDSMQDAVLALFLFSKKQPMDFEYNVTNIKGILEKIDLSTGYIIFLKEISELKEKQKNSCVEFIRRDKFVFASDDYQIKYVTEKELAELISKGKLFLKEAMGRIK
ncbi:MAG: hypothetical protein ABIJ34_05415 [archaeon]